MKIIFVSDPTVVQFIQEFLGKSYLVLATHQSQQLLEVFEV